jgi:Ca2+:H+ antiporter
MLFRMPKFSIAWLLVFVPVAFLVDHVRGVVPPLVFLCAALAIVPVASYIGRSTEHLSAYTGDVVGGLLNATFGNLPELIIMVIALKAGLYQMVAASIVGGIFFNLLLALGLSLLIGGLHFHTQTFNPSAAAVYGSMMFIAVISLALPSMYDRLFAAGDAAIPQQQSLSLGFAVLLVVMYGLYLLFMLKTHREAFASAGAEGGESEAGHGEPGTAHWSLGKCIVVLVGASVLAAFLSKILVGAVEGTGESLGLPQAFIGVVLLASVGAVAEGISAVGMASKNKLDLTFGIVMGSCIQIALFVAPMLVFASYFAGPEPLQLLFQGTIIGILLLVVLVGVIVAASGTSSWFKGGPVDRRVPDDRDDAVLRASRRLKRVFATAPTA